ncbi:MAG: Gfo/Idh/MocA family protein [Bacillota bacterium]
MPRIGFGVIGAGLWGEAHAYVYATHSGARLVAVCDVREDKATEMAARYGAKPFTDYRAMLEDPEIEAVGIATPDFAHADPLIACAERGKAVHVEKPLATNWHDLERIAAALKAHPVPVMVDFHARWSPPFALVRQSITRGEIGQLISAYYRLNDKIEVPTSMLGWAAKSSILWFLGSHSVDTLRFLLGSEVRRVYAVSRAEVLKSMGYDVPDIYQTTLEFENGVIAQIENNWIIPNSNPNVNDIKLNILGSKGMFNLDLTHNQAIERYLENSADNPDFLVKPTVHGKRMGFAYEAIRDFVDRIGAGQEPLATAADGMKVSCVIIAIMESAARRKPVEVKYISL